MRMSFCSSLKRANIFRHYLNQEKWINLFYLSDTLLEHIHNIDQVVKVIQKLKIYLS
jgi:hypothetical protein